MKDPGALLISVILMVVSSLSVYDYFNEGYKPALAFAVLFGLGSILWMIFWCTLEILEAIKPQEKETDKNVSPAKEQTAD